MNAVKCAHCGAVIESKHRHDFVGHTCSAADGREVFIAVDGGTAYKRRVGSPTDMIELDDTGDFSCP